MVSYRVCLASVSLLYGCVLFVFFAYCVLLLYVLILIRFFMAVVWFVHVR